MRSKKTNGIDVDKAKIIGGPNTIFVSSYKNAEMDYIENKDSIIEKLRIFHEYGVKRNLITLPFDEWIYFELFQLYARNLLKGNKPLCEIEE